MDRNQFNKDMFYVRRITSYLGEEDKSTTVSPFTTMPKLLSRSVESYCTTG
jgi:hypothetical protein